MMDALNKGKERKGHGPGCKEGQRQTHTHTHAQGASREGRRKMPDLQHVRTRGERLLVERRRLTRCRQCSRQSYRERKRKLKHKALEESAPPAVVGRLDALFALHGEFEVDSVVELDRQCEKRDDSQPKLCTECQMIRTMLEPTDGLLCTAAEDGHVSVV